jgi:hypothetical protein
MKRETTSTRSTRSIDAVAQAAAQGGLPAAPALGKITAIAGLAGFVLRLFRRTVRPEGSRRDPARMRPGCPQRPPAPGRREKGGRARG